MFACCGDVTAFAPSRKPQKVLIMIGCDFYKRCIDRNFYRKEKQQRDHIQTQHNYVLPQGQYCELRRDEEIHR